MGLRQDLPIGAIVLAAGRSSRMGEPKQLLAFCGKTLLQRTLENVCASQAQDIVLVLGFAAEAIASQIGVEGVRVVVNPDHEQGMGTSLRTGLAALDAQTQAALIVLADQPFVSPTTLDQIINQYWQSDAQIVIPMYRGFRGNPVLLDRSVFSEVMSLSGDVGCRAIFGDHLDGIVKVPVGDIGILLDIDTPEDLARWQHFGQQGEDSAALMQVADLQGRDLPQPAVSASGSQDRLIVVGTDEVALALTKMGSLMGFQVTIVDPILDAADVPEADAVMNALDFSGLAPQSYIVVASRGRCDEEAVEQALLANSDYVGLLANRRRAQEITRALAAKGLAAERLATLHAPAGIDIGAQTAEEIALSILAEVVSVRRKRE